MRARYKTTSWYRHPGRTHRTFKGNRTTRQTRDQHLRDSRRNLRSQIPGCHDDCCCAMAVLRKVIQIFPSCQTNACVTPTGQPSLVAHISTHSLELFIIWSISSSVNVNRDDLVVVCLCHGLNHSSGITMERECARIAQLDGPCHLSPGRVLPLLFISTSGLLNHAAFRDNLLS